MRKYPNMIKVLCYHVYMDAACDAAKMENGMALISGKNASGKKFDVVDEDGDVFGSFNDMGDAVSCGQAAPWFAGEINIRRDIEIHQRSHLRHQELLRYNRALFDTTL